MLSSFPASHPHLARTIFSNLGPCFALMSKKKCGDHLREGYSPRCIGQVKSRALNTLAGGLMMSFKTYGIIFVLAVAPISVATLIHSFGGGWGHNGHDVK